MCLDTMAPFISWFLYLSWGFLFMCVLCILKWLDMQPRVEQLRLNAATSQASVQEIGTNSMERGVKIAIKVCLVLSIAFLCLHFIVMLAPRSHSNANALKQVDALQR